MKFEVGKYYKHPSGKMFVIVGEVNTLKWGKCLVAENNYADYLSPVSLDETHAEGWREITEEEWLLDFKGGGNSRKGR